MEADSWVDKDGDWRQKKISLMGVVQSFASQLKIGQDMTRVSLPCIFLYPFSMLEVMGHRELSAFELVYEANKHKDPLDRILAIVSWVLATLPQERWIKKPYNPVIGETHECWVESANYGKTVFTSEQVSHHPPVSAENVRNIQEDVDMAANLSFGVRYGGNSVSIVTSGGAKLNLNKFNETYEFPKRTPDMVVRNLIFGKKKIFWEGDISVSCKETKYTVSLNFAKSGSDNSVKGKVEQLGDGGKRRLVGTIEGKCGEIIHYTDGNSSRILIDHTAVTRAKIHYLPLSEMHNLASLRVWTDVNKFILKEELDKADELKKAIEEEQRKRIHAKTAEGSISQGRYFALQEKDLWKIKVEPPLLALERAKAEAKTKAEDEKHQAEEEKAKAEQEKSTEQPAQN